MPVLGMCFGGTFDLGSTSSQSRLPNPDASVIDEEIEMEDKGSESSELTDRNKIIEESSSE